MCRVEDVLTLLCFSVCVVRPTTSVVPTSSYGDMKAYIIVGGSGAGAVVIVIVVVLTIIFCRKSKHQFLHIKLRINCELCRFTNALNSGRQAEQIGTLPWCSCPAIGLDLPFTIKNNSALVHTVL